MNAYSHPRVTDYVARFVLKLAKKERQHYQGEAAQFYEGFFLDKDVHQAAYDLRFQMRRLGAVKALIEALRNHECPRVLDVGCGVGYVIGSLPASWGKIGLAYANADLKLARQVAGESTEFIRGSAESLPFASGTVDAILCLEVLEHLQNDCAAVGEFTRVLKPGGVLVISVPAEYYFSEYLGLIGHFRHYSRDELEKLLTHHRMRVICYIDRHCTMERVHYFPYILLEGLHRALNRCGWSRQSLYVRPIIGAAYRGIAWSLSRCYRDRSQSSLAHDPRSTFMVVRKCGPAE